MFAQNFPVQRAFRINFCDFLFLLITKHSRPRRFVVIRFGRFGINRTARNKNVLTNFIFQKFGGRFDRLRQIAARVNDCIPSSSRQFFQIGITVAVNLFDIGNARLRIFCAAIKKRYFVIILQSRINLNADLKILFRR